MNFKNLSQLKTFQKSHCIQLLFTNFDYLQTPQHDKTGLIKKLLWNSRMAAQYLYTMRNNNLCTIKFSLLENNLQNIRNTIYMLS